MTTMYFRALLEQNGYSYDKDNDKMFSLYTWYIKNNIMVAEGLYNNFIGICDADKEVMILNAENRDITGLNENLNDNLDLILTANTYEELTYKIRQRSVEKLLETL